MANPFGNMQIDLPEWVDMGESGSPDISPLTSALKKRQDRRSRMGDVITEGDSIGKTMGEMGGGGGPSSL